MASDLVTQLLLAKSVQKRIEVLNQSLPVFQFLQKNPLFFDGYPLEHEAAAKQLIAIGQWERLLGTEPLEKKHLEAFLEQMTAIDAFYRELGGIVGYQQRVLRYLQASEDERSSEIAAFHPPSFIDIAEKSSDVQEAILSGINALPELTEMYPLGGAADRLHLVDEITGIELPAAKLNYAGKTLFEALVRDLSAREFLYFSLYGKQLDTPIVIMTSAEKKNHQHVLQICEEHRWFGRRKEHFRIFMQPLVPAVDSEGNWCLLGPLSPMLKPGGHGALWKLAQDEGVFEWLSQLGRTKGLIRQLNNPIAAIDYGLLALFGIGVKEKMRFGFASCPRLVQSAEGVNVVIEKKNGQIALTNIEYCDFHKYGIEDSPLKEGEPYSRFSSNTNILFADLQAISEAVRLCPFPGLLVNLKNGSYTTLSGEKREGMIARLESTMQNIADVFVETAEEEAKKKGITKKTFVTYNRRNKTIATAKKGYVPGGPVRETPEECFYTQLQSARELLAGSCQFQLPPERSLAEYLEKGPESLFLYHPALGPLYSLIAQKVQKGRLGMGSELQLEIADLQIEQLDLEGSLLILAKQPIGHFDEKGLLRYSHQTGRAILRDVSIRNEGVDWSQSAPYWRNAFQRKGALEVHLEGHSEWVAEGIEFVGPHHFTVPNGIRMRVWRKNGKLRIEQEALKEGPFWTYSIDERREILATLAF